MIQGLFRKTMLKKLLLFILILLSVTGVYYTVRVLKEKTQVNLSLINCIPKDAAIIVEVKNPIKMGEFLLYNNVIWNDLKTINFLGDLDVQLQKIDSLIKNESIFEESGVKNNIIVSIHPSVKEPDFLLGITSTIQTFNEIKRQLKDKGIETKDVFIKYSHPFTIVASNEELLNKSCLQLERKETLLNDSSFKRLKGKVSNSSNVHIYTNSSNLKKLAIPHLQKTGLENWQTNNIWSVYDVILKNDEIILNGLSIANNNTLENKSSQLINEAMLPFNLLSINEYTIDEKRNKGVIEQIENDCNCRLSNYLGDWVENHLATITFNDDLKAVLIPITKTGIATDLAQIVAIDTTTYLALGLKVNKIRSSSLAQLSGLLIDDMYYVVHHSTLVISSYKGLKQLIYDWKKRAVRDKPSFYNVFSQEMLAQESTTSHYAKIKYVAKLGKAMVKKAYLNNFEKSMDLLIGKFSIAYQTSDLTTDYTHEALIVKSNSITKKQNDQLWELSLENEIIFGPKLVKNHKTKRLDVLVQDQANIIYLINSFGKIKWSKKLDSKIVEQINQIDLFGNNKYQMVFNTKAKIYLLDINGNTVSGFPIELESPAASAMSVFDYEKNNNYRFWISCANKQTYNYNKEGRKVTGWANPVSESPMVASYQYFNIENKDYFYNLDSAGRLYLINRKGEQIMKIEERIRPKKNKLYFQKRTTLSSSSFVFIDDSTNKIVNYTLSNNKMESILDSNNTKATLEIIDLKNDGYLGFLSFSKNTIEVYAPDKTLAYRNEFLFDVEPHYSVVKNRKGKKYIVLRDEENQELTLLKMDLVQFNKNVMKGDLHVEVGNIDNSHQQNLVCRKDKNTITAYVIIPNDY